MKIDIVEDSFNLSIIKSTALTSELLEVYLKHFNETNKKYVVPSPVCEKCNQTITNYKSLSKRVCDDCRKKHKKEQVNAWNKNHPEKNKEYQELKTIRKNLREGREISNESKTLKTQMFNDNERLAKIGDECGSGKRYNNPIYKPVLDYITEHCGIPVNKGELAILIREFYEKKGKMITKGTALLYANDYQKHINEESKAHDAIKKELHTPETRSKSPDNTALFLDWIKTNDIINFETKDFVDAFDNMTQESAEKIIFHQISKNTILQMGQDTFKVSNSFVNSKDKEGESDEETEA